MGLSKNTWFWPMAPRQEQRFPKPQVGGSNPPSPSTVSSLLSIGFGESGVLRKPAKNPYCSETVVDCCHCGLKKAGQALSETQLPVQFSCPLPKGWQPGMPGHGGKYCRAICQSTENVFSSRHLWHVCEGIRSQSRVKAAPHLAQKKSFFCRNSERLTPGRTAFAIRTSVIA